MQLRTSRGYLLPRTDSSLNRTNSVTYIDQERTSITGNTCHVTTTHRCVTSPRTWKTQARLLLRIGPCLQSCCLATRWWNPLQYAAYWLDTQPSNYSPYFGTCLLDWARGKVRRNMGRSSGAVVAVSVLWEGDELYAKPYYNLYTRYNPHLTKFTALSAENGQGQCLSN
jgi:hypothetical protein